jgi:periplasmic protein TonB
VAPWRVRVVARFGPRGPRSPFVFGSLAAHGAFLGALVLSPYCRHAPRIPAHAIMVELTSAPPSAGSAQAAAPPAAPAKAEPPAQRAEPRKPEPAPKPPKQPKKKEEPKPKPPPKPAPPAGGAPAAAANGASHPTGPSGPPLAPGAASITAMETGGSELAWYRSAVTAALLGRWQKPLLEGTAGALEVAVAFEIRRDGSVSDVHIERESGVPSLDRSALRAVSDSAPFPPLPPTWRQPSLLALYVFQFYPE